MSRRLTFALTALLSAAPLLADPLDVALMNAGDVRFPPTALRERDYLIATYAERPEDLPISSRSLADLPGRLPVGCLPVVSIDTASGEHRLGASGELSFGCSGLPARAAIFAFEEGRWRPRPTHRTVEGRVATHFTETAVFGVFLPPENEIPRI